MVSGDGHVRTEGEPGSAQTCEYSYLLWGFNNRILLRFFSHFGGVSQRPPSGIPENHSVYGAGSVLYPTRALEFGRPVFLAALSSQPGLLYVGAAMGTCVHVVDHPTPHLLGSASLTINFWEPCFISPHHTPLTHPSRHPRLSCRPIFFTSSQTLRIFTVHHSGVGYVHREMTKSS